MFSLVIDIVLIFFSYSGLSGILGSVRKQNIIRPVLGGVRDVVHSINAYVQT